MKTKNELYKVIRLTDSHDKPYIVKNVRTEEVQSAWTSVVDARKSCSLLNAIARK